MRPLYFAAIIAITVMAIALAVVIMKMSTTNMSSITRTTGSSEINSQQRIDVRAAPITVPLPRPYSGTITGFHLALVYVNATGSDFVCEGLPFDPATGKTPSDSALISNPPGLVTRGYCYPYSFGFDARSSDVQSVTVVSSSKEASQIYNCLVKKTAAFNAANVPYYMTTGPNSNSFARTLLEYCKIPATKPAGATVTPGWDLVINLGERM